MWFRGFDVVLGSIKSELCLLYFETKNHTHARAHELTRTYTHTRARARKSARELPPLVCHMTFSMLHLVFLMITCNFATIFIRELREGIGRHCGPEGGMMACSYTFSDMTAFALFIIFLCTIT